MSTAPPVDFLSHVNGLVQAFVRFEERAMGRDAEDAYHALFECLAWAASIDERLGYPKESPELRGLRFARHRVHHQWADALVLKEGVRFPIRFPMVFFEYEWRPLEELPAGRPGDPDEVLYRMHLAAQPARATLGMAVGYLRGLPQADPTNPPLVQVPKRDA
jgi:hypothetical protein